MAATLDELTAKAERVSQIYAARCQIRRDDDWFALKLQEELGELVAEYLRASSRGRLGDLSKDTVRTALEDEAGDVFAQLLLFCHHNRIDLEAALERKWFRYLPEAEATP
jgi:NTP pyrophosphatase (non-canonical NTP hydrolase)